MIDMLTNCAWCIPQHSEEADEVVHTSLINVCSKFGASHKVFSFHYPWGNGCIEILCHFLKTCIWKYVSAQLAWDEVVPIACTAYNFVPNTQKKVHSSLCLEGMHIWH